MMHILIRLPFCCVLLWKTVGTQVKIMDVTPPQNGDRVNLTCTISNFAFPAIWDFAGVTVSTCFNSGTCSPPSDGVRYSFSASSSSIVVTILSFNSTIDTFTWKCECIGVFDTYFIKVAIPVTNVKLENSSGYILNSTINIVQGKSIDFRCSTSPSGSRPHALFRWYKREGNQLPSMITDQSISTAPELQPVPGQPEVDLLISYSTLTLQGDTVYQNLYIFCEGRDVTNRSNYVQSWEIQLNIVYPPRVQLFPNNSEYNVTEGTRNFRLNCNIIEANPLPQANSYTWLHETSVIPEQSLSSYTLPNVQQSDTGAYSCRAENEYGNGTSNSLNFNVQYGPTISGLDDIDVEESSTVNVTCKVSGHPTPSVNWTRSDKVVSNSPLLMITSISRLNGGNYTCTASSVLQPTGQSSIPVHVLDTLRVNVLYGPDPESIHLSPNRTSHELAESFTLSVNCSTDCFPDCQYRWTGPGGISPSNTGLLSIISIGRNQTGQYACTASNPKLPDKTTTIIMNVVVLYPPVLTMKATNTSKGGRMVINCTASGVPDNYTFYKWTHMAPDVSRTLVREPEPTRVSGSEVSFTIEGATYQDTGFYVCKASNGIKHYSSGQLVMEDMVIIWIADQPIITSNVRYFDAEKGKTGYIHIEFYSGVIQPVVTWYLVKNGTMELLQNSSDFGIYLSALTVEIQYYQKTVQLPGYIASLEVYDVDEEQFTSYKVEIKNSFAEPVFRTLELKSRSPPETPSNLSVVPDSVTTHSLQLSWRAGFHGGVSQTFVIEYREAGRTIWLNKIEPRGLVLYVILNSSIADLKDGTKYEFRIYSENVYNRSQVSLTINETTKTVPSISETPRLPVAGIAGGISAGLVIIVIMGIGIVLWRRGQHKKRNERDNDVSLEHEERQSQMKSSSVQKDEASGKEYEGLHFTETEANQYLQLNGITSEENRNTNIRSPESDSYEQLHSYVNNDIQMYSSLKIPNTSKDAKQKYENTWIKKA